VVALAYECHWQCIPVVVPCSLLTSRDCLELWAACALTAIGWWHRLLATILGQTLFMTAIGRSW
jgi:hypothetical protein